MEATTYLPTVGKTGKTTLAQVSERDCLKRIADREAEIEALDADVQRASATLHGSYAAAGSLSPADLDDLGEQIERLHRRRRTTHSLLDGEKQQLNTIRKQIRAEAVQAVRAEFDAVMSERTSKARTLDATIRMMAAQLEEIDLLGRKAIGLFSECGDGLTHNQVMQRINRVDLQAEVETLIAKMLPKRIWRDADGVFPDPQFESPLASRVDAERQWVLAETDLRLEQITNT